VTKQGQTTFSVLCLLCAAGPAAAAGQGGKAHFAPGPPQPPSTVGVGRAGGTSGLYRDPRRAPAMAPDRKVTEQDCTKPVDLTQGNLKCK
jgi:hypothetical protein